MSFPGPWLKGPALEILLKFGKLKPGDFVLSRHAYGESIVLDVEGSMYVFLNPKSGTVRQQRFRGYIIGITAWQRPPLDIEL